MEKIIVKIWNFFRRFTLLYPISVDVYKLDYLSFKSNAIPQFFRKINDNK